MTFQLFKQMDTHLCNDHKPSLYFTQMLENGELNDYPLNMLGNLENTEQSPIHHPEGNVWNHTMLVIDEAAKVKDQSRDKRVFMWAALLHDIGKAVTTSKHKGKITSYDHDKAGARMVPEFLKDLADQDFIDRVSALVRWHMQVMFVIKSTNFADIEGMVKETDPDEVALLGYCDRMGRTGVDKRKTQMELKEFSEKVKAFGG